MNLMTFGFSILDRVLISLLVNSFNLGTSLNLSILTTLTATQVFFFVSWLCTPFRISPSRRTLWEGSFLSFYSLQGYECIR